MEKLNADALAALTTQHGVKLSAFPADLIAAARKQADDVLGEVAGRNAISGKVQGSYRAFREQTAEWSRVSIEAVLRARA
jgi:TRAP-type mannitol/chloroaromatic compound transport system substrate-binding protein